MKITVEGGELSPQEQQHYIDEMRSRHPDKIFTEMKFVIDGDLIRVEYAFEPVPFERIRRITGYLVGDLNRWNDEKKAEEADRVKHSTSDREEKYGS